MSVSSCAVNWLTLRPWALCLFHQIPGCESLPFQVTADDIVARVFQIFCQVRACAVDRRPDQIFDIFLFYYQLSSLPALDIPAKVLTLIQELC